MAGNKFHSTLVRLLKFAAMMDDAPPEPTDISAFFRGMLEPRVSDEMMATAIHQPFVQLLGRTLRTLFTRLSDGLVWCRFNAAIVNGTNPMRWAAVISQYVPTAVQRMINSGQMDITRLPWTSTGDVGLYWLALRPLLPDHHWHD